jgi:hypothetical protein
MGIGSTKIGGAISTKIFVIFVVQIHNLILARLTEKWSRRFS